MISNKYTMQYFAKKMIVLTKSLEEINQPRKIQLKSLSKIMELMLLQIGCIDFPVLFQSGGQFSNSLGVIRKAEIYLLFVDWEKHAHTPCVQIHKVIDKYSTIAEGLSSLSNSMRNARESYQAQKRSMQLGVDSLRAQVKDTGMGTILFINVKVFSLVRRESRRQFLCVIIRRELKTEP